MQFSKLVTEFALQNELTLKGEGPFECDFDEGENTVVFSAADRGAMAMEATITHVDPRSEEGRETLTTLLKGNLALLRDQKGTIAMDENSGNVVIFERLTFLNLTIANFTNQVEGFLNELEFLKRGLSNSR